MMATQSAIVPGPAPGAERARKVRDPERSRAAILDAAEELFAHFGFRGASLGAIAKTASVSTGLTGYFFGSKEGLHREVLLRVFARRDAALQRVATEAEELLGEASDGGEAALRRLVDGYVAFLCSNPTFVPLLTRDALEHPTDRAVRPRHAQQFAERLGSIMARTGVVEAEYAPDQLFLSVIGMCYFPLEHDVTIVAGMGQRAWTEAFQEKRVDHIVRLLLGPSAQLKPHGLR